MASSAKNVIVSFTGQTLTHFGGLVCSSSSPAARPPAAAHPDHSLPSTESSLQHQRVAPGPPVPDPARPRSDREHPPAATQRRLPVPHRPAHVPDRRPSAASWSALQSRPDRLSGLARSAPPAVRRAPGPAQHVIFDWTRRSSRCTGTRRRRVGFNPKKRGRPSYLPCCVSRAHRRLLGRGVPPGEHACRNRDGALWRPPEQRCRSAPPCACGPMARSTHGRSSSAGGAERRLRDCRPYDATAPAARAGANYHAVAAG